MRIALNSAWAQNEARFWSWFLLAAALAAGLIIAVPAVRERGSADSAKAPVGQRQTA